MTSAGNFAGAGTEGDTRMADDLKRRQPEDPKQVNVNEPWELKTWTAHFGVSETKLRQAVKAVGPMVSNVRAWLAKN